MEQKGNNHLPNIIQGAYGRAAKRVIEKEKETLITQAANPSLDPQRKRAKRLLWDNLNRQKRIEQKDAERRIKLLDEENNKLLQLKKEKEVFYNKYLKKEQFSDLPERKPEMNDTISTISQEEIDTKFRNYQKKEVRSSLTLESEDNQKPKRVITRETRIPVPSFAKNNHRLRKKWNRPQEQQEHKIKIDALNLEMSETFKQGKLKEALKQKEEDVVIPKGKLLDSLDLNTGLRVIEKKKETLKMPAISKRKPMNYIPPKKVANNELRDSLEEIDFSEKPKEEPPKLKKEPSYDSDFERDENDNTDWLRQSMRESMAKWSKEVSLMNKEIQDLGERINLNKKGNLQHKEKKPKKKIEFNDEVEVAKVDFCESPKMIKRGKRVLNKSKSPINNNRVTKPVQKKSQSRSRSKNRDFKPFEPKQIPLDEYYKLLEERTKENEPTETPEIAKNTKYNWEQVKEKFQEEKEDFWNENQPNKHKESLKNNFMDQNEDSLFSKFKEHKKKDPKFEKLKAKEQKISRQQELQRAREAKKKLKVGEATDIQEERKQAKLKKAKMDEIKKKYTNISRSRSRHRSKSNGPKSCITKLGQNRSEIQVKPKIPTGQRQRKIKDTQTEITRGRLRPNKFRKISPDDTTKCTRDDDINVGQFLWDDLAYLNQEEAKLQQQILDDHKNTIMQVKAVEKKHNIDTGITSTRQIVKQLNSLDPYETMKKFQYKKEDEEQIEESLENLNILLAQKGKDQKEKKKVYKKMADKMNIRLDSTSPVRSVPVASQHHQNPANPFSYAPEPYQPTEIPSFKPRSVLPSTTGISQVTDPKSAITALPSKGAGKPLLGAAPQAKIGSYLNAHNLAAIDQTKKEAELEETYSSDGFEDYNEVCEEIGKEKKQGGKFRKHARGIPSKGPKQTSGTAQVQEGLCEDYEEDFEEPEVKERVFVNPKFKIMD
ncbi:unnamed protein product [Moneuplotes crassus]|uniref:Uncharacterized protein n=1 Tax=Euplotes crassus TaxID=5936 RepID=A0AAD1XZT7_EUPCR|nr:unnamed protein product [Moneuplotes crassus]